MANFEKIVQWLIYQEDDKRTPGKIVNLGDGAGLTRFGITSKNFWAMVPAEFFTDLPFADAVTEAKLIYRSQYWNRMSCDTMDDQVAAPLLSFAVNKNIPKAVKNLQQVLNVNVDGAIGGQTMHELNQKDPVIVAKLFRAGWIFYYQQIAAVNPNDQQFLQGWINRANFPFPSPLVPNIYA